MLGKSIQTEENLARRAGDNGESTRLTYPLANETKFQSIQSTNG